MSKTVKLFKILSITVLGSTVMFLYQNCAPLGNPDMKSLSQSSVSDNSSSGSDNAIPIDDDPITDDLPGSGGPPLGVHFYDAFESGDLSKTNAHGFRWQNTNRTSIVRDDGYAVFNGSMIMNGPHLDKLWENFPHSEGRHSLRFRYPAGEPWAEQRFSLGGEYPEIWVSFWLRVPLNFIHPGGNDNQKLFALWMDNYEFKAKGPTVVWQYRGNGNGGSISRLYHVGTDVGQSQRHSGEKSGDVSPFISIPEDRGRWMQLVFRVVISSSSQANDGIIQMWQRWEDDPEYKMFHNQKDAILHAPSGGPSGFTAGYILGWANAAYPENTEFLLDDFTVSTTSLLEE